MKVRAQDVDVVRRLGEEYAAAASLGVHAERAELWRRLNDLAPVRPLVWINEIPWNELNVNDELTVRCEDDFCRGIESALRMVLYQWRHFPGDMILQPFFACGKIWSSTGFGLSANVEYLDQDETTNIRAMRFTPAIVEAKDVEKIQTPRVTYDAAATEANHQRMCELLGDILPVRTTGMPTYWSCPADNVFMWFGLEQAMMDLVMRPEMVHEAMRRTVEGYLAELDQMEALGLLECNNGPYRIGSGGFGHTGGLPQPAGDGRPARAIESWGCSAAQIFSDISPRMHWEFVLQYEQRWLARWGMTYYGCCEPLHRKMEILRRVPNLRKVSCSPQADAEMTARQIGRDYVLSLKPNPAILAENRWRPDQARRELRENLERTRGCNVEIILKDISTVRHKPERLWEWAAIASELAEEFAP
ncbi:MAG: hypothetical protein GXY33_22000 [Phycisphaerae bacterium]|nr:hypothetical protein [Phycisphaerae bacterium]